MEHYIDNSRANNASEEIGEGVGSSGATFGKTLKNIWPVLRCRFNISSDGRVK